MQNKILNFVSRLSLFFALLSPLIFFTDLTLNPFQAQIIILNISLFVFCLCNYERAQYNKIDTVFFIFTAVLFATWLLSLCFGGEYRLNIFYNFFGYGSILFTWFLAYAVGRSLGEKRFLPAMNILLIVGAAAAAYGILQACGIEFIWPQSYNAGVISTFGNPNFLSGFLLLLVFPLIYYSLQDTKYKYFYLAGLIIYLLFILISGARSSIAAFVLGCAVMLFYKPLRAQLLKNKKTILIGLLLFIFIFLVLPSKSKGVLISKTEEQVKIIQGDKNPQSYAQRKMLWISAVNIFKSSPLVGKGFGNFALYYGFEQGKMIFDNPALQQYRVQSYNTHNFILQLAAESGVFGLLSFAALFSIFFYYFKKYFRSKEKKDIVFFLMLSLLAFMADNMLNITIFVAAPAFVFYFFAGISSSEILRNRQTPLNVYFKKGFIILFGTFVVVIIKIFFSSAYQLDGYKLYLSKNFYAAEQDISKSVRAYKGNYEGWFLKGNNETALGDTITAFESYARAARLNPSYDEPVFNAAVIASALQNYPDAEKYAVAALRLNPGRELSYMILADAVSKTASMTADDKKYLLHGLSLFGSDMTLCQNTGDAFVQTDKNKAVEILESCVAADTLDKAVLSKLAELSPSSKIITQASLAQSIYMLLSTEGRPSENAISGAELYARQYPQDPNAALILARAAYNAGDYDAAIEILSAAVSKYPQNKSLEIALENTTRKNLTKNNNL
ncbi:MAG: O-antigen ligase family protein [Elusimicrobia bacterium]|nr:O-antigen ligase family protein [Elusimicrobiota bacterium]